MPGIVAEFIAFTGAALAGANIVALARPAILRRRGIKDVQDVGSRSRCYLNIAVGVAIAAFGVYLALHS